MRKRFVIDFEANRQHVGSAVTDRRPEIGQRIEWRGQTWKVVSRGGHLVRARLCYVFDGVAA